MTPIMIMIVVVKGVYKPKVNKCSDRNIEVKLPALLGSYDRQNDSQTNRPEGEVQWIALTDKDRKNILD